MMLYNGKKSRYFNNNATPEEEVAQRVYIAGALQNEIENATHSGLKIPYAIVYGFVDQNGRKKLLRNSPVILTAKRFDDYIAKHKQTVLAVFNRNYVGFN